MAVLIVAEVEGQTQEKYDGMLDAMGETLRQAKGFIAHGAGPAGDGWRTFEVWESAADATRFFAAYVHPNMPEGVKPKRTLVELQQPRPRRSPSAGLKASTSTSRAAGAISRWAQDWKAR
jgi:hypothetical protein